MSYKVFLVFLETLWSVGVSAQYHNGAIGDRTKQSVNRMHKQREEAGKRIGNYLCPLKLF